MGRIQDRVAIVTGGSTGLGKATCSLLAAEGGKVVVVDIQDELGRETVEEIKARGDSAEYYHMDVTVEDEISRVCAQVFERHGHIDILVNNAGITGAPKPTHEITVEEWDEVLNVDARGVFFCTKHAVPYMIKSGGGSIVNISSVYGNVGGMDVPPPFLYHAAKGAVRIMTKSDALCYAKDKIRVNSIHPGWLWTPMLEGVGRDSTEGPEAFHKRILSHVPLGHYGEPIDVAYGVLYLASDESKFSTGTELIIDGGFLAM
ncbi:MAG: glucose 1-dehydrogenase [Actinobacteria bacterium]|jgi:NAD(P)-dependent dehydrogenase (short-subunit alcohol dehydrogenase family)|nr:glucose 1-dehydrogenase [Actinomycetota bacterium]